MRIIGGQWGGRQFYPPKLKPTRPTTDIAKEALFNILQHQVDFSQLSFLDLFAGTGQLTLEVASRGCTDIVSVDKHGKSVAFIKKTLEEFGAEGAEVIRDDVFRYLSNCTRSFDLIFAGPPYPLPRLADIPQAIFNQNVLAPDGLFILEHNQNHDFSAHPGWFRVKAYGQTHFSMFNPPENQNHG